MNFLDAKIGKTMKKKMTKVKEKMTFSECSDWDAYLEEQDRQKRELENKQDNEGKSPQGNPTSMPVALTFSPPNLL